jgi:hypothetical protein
MELPVKIVKTKDLGTFFSDLAPVWVNRRGKEGWAAADAVIPASTREPPSLFFRRRNTQLRTSVAKREN